MKIVMFKYNKSCSAIIKGTTMSQDDHCTRNRLASNQFLANGYEDRFLWEEAASLRPEKKQEYSIPGNWQ